MMTTPILQVENLYVELDNEPVIEDLSLTVNEGEYCIIIGPNGAGKTTLLRSLLGLIPYRGTIRWTIDQCGYLPPRETLHHTELPPLLVHEFFALKKRSATNLLPLLTAVGLDQSMLDKQFGCLSSGQLQRILVAWVLSSNPEVIVLDEPAAGLDVAGERMIYTLLQQLAKKTVRAAIMVTHNIAIAREYADTIIGINKRLIWQGLPNQLTQDQLVDLYGLEKNMGNK